MRLDSLSIKNFRGIREAKLDDLADVSILIGRNTCGKSTVAEAISYLAVAAHEPKPDPLGRSQREYWRQQRNESAHVSPGPQPNRDLRDQFRLPREAWHNLDISRPIEVVGNVSEGACRIREFGVRASAPLERMHALIERSFIADDQPDDILLLARDFCGPIMTFGPSDSRNDSIERTLWKWLYGDRKDKYLMVAVNEIFGTAVEQIQVFEDSGMVLGFANYALPLDVNGDGMRTAMRCLMMLADRRNTVFIAEEPECHHHPGSLDKFARAMCRQAKTQQVQLLLTTHSIECVRSFLAGAEKAGSQGAVFHLKLRDGLLESRRLDREQVEGMLGTGLDVRNLDLYV